MTKTRPAYLLIAVAALVSGLLAGTASAAPGGEGQSEHERVVDFWTHARVAQAVPRHIVFEPGPGFVPVAKPPDTPGNGGGNGGGGGDDGDSSLVTGESWTSGGLVSQATGKVLFALDGSYYVCSASVVVDPDDTHTAPADSLVLTAGHCAHDQTTDGFASNWVFIPAYDEAPAPLTTNQSFCADTKYGCWSASALTVHDGFVSAGGFNDQAVVHDFAVATVGSGGKGGTDLEATVGAQGIAFADVETETTYAFGYPAAQKYKGNDLVYCAGPVGTDPNTGGTTYRIECDMTGGSSGGPWLTPFTDSEGASDHGAGTLSSLNSYGYRGDSGMYGPKFNTDTAAVYDAANGATEDTVVGS